MVDNQQRAKLRPFLRDRNLVRYEPPKSIAAPPCAGLFFAFEKVSTMLRLVIAALAFGIAQASAETVINFDDGSTYTLEEGQEIFISTSNSALFKRQIMRNKDTFFRVQKPWAKRDYVPQPTDGLQPGSHEWCATFVPWSEGMTFNQQTWDRYCDTNNDGVYDENDDRWDG